MSQTSSIESRASESVESTDSETERVAGETPAGGVEEAPSTGEQDSTPVGPVEAETSAAERAERPPLRARRWVQWTGIVGVVAVLVASLSTAAVLGWKLKEARDVDAAANQAKGVAQQYAITLTSVNSDHLDQDFAAVLNGATGEFKDMYSRSSTQLRQLLSDNKANAHGTVVDAGIKSATKTRVEVMLFIDQTVTNTVAPDPRVDRSRVVMTMQLVDGRWLADKVDLP